MLNEHQIAILPERITERLSRINAEYLQSIGEVIKEIGEIRPSDAHKLQKIYEKGADGKKIAKKLAKVSQKNIEEIYEMFDIVAKENYNYSEPFYKAKNKPFIKYEDNEDLQKYVKSLAKQTVNEYINLTQHTAFAVFSDKKCKSIAPLFEANKNKVNTSLSKTYTKVIDYAVTKVQLGTEGYNSAMKSCLRALADSGIKAVDYATGYSRRLDTAVRQNILWGIKQCNQNVADMTGEEFGADGYEISYHSHPRPSHEDMGGKQYTIGKARTVNGVYYPSFSDVEDLLNDFGCLHFKFSILVGISKPAYSKSELAELKAKDKETITFEGKEYTRYEASQTQNKLETAIKHQKELANLASTAGNEDLRHEVQHKLNLLTNKYRRFCNASELPTRMERIKVAGFRNVKTHSELWTQQIDGVVTSNGITISRIAQHVYDQAKTRKILELLDVENMTKTLIKPLDVGKIKVDAQMRKSQQFVGEYITLAVNPDTGTVASVWKTSTKKAKKLKGAILE